jgi:hypothetical protein
MATGMFCLIREDLSPTLRVENSLRASGRNATSFRLPGKTLSIKVEELSSMGLDRGGIRNLLQLGSRVNGSDHLDPIGAQHIVSSKGFDADVAHVGGDQTCEPSKS